MRTLCVLAFVFGTPACGIIWFLARLLWCALSGHAVG